MAVIDPTYQTEVNLKLIEKTTHTPIANKSVRIYFSTDREEPEILGGTSYSFYDVTRTTDSNGIINTTITHKGPILGFVTAEFNSDDAYKPSIISVPKQLWKPALNGETGADYRWSYSESNGEAIGKGFVFHNGFNNTTKWQLNFEFRHDDIRYTGICFLAKLGQFNGSGDTTNIALSSWEGSWPGGTKYFTQSMTSTSADQRVVDWFDVTVTKIDSTHVRLQSKVLNRDTNVEVSWLPNATFLTCGATHNTNSSFGPCRIRNVEAKEIY